MSYEALAPAATNPSYTPSTRKEGYPPPADIPGGPAIDHSPKALPPAPDIAILEGRMEALRNPELSCWTALWVAIFGTWTDAGQDIVAEQAYNAKKNTTETEGSSADEDALKNVDDAYNLASESSKWKYSMEKGRLLLNQSKWQAVVETLNTIPTEHLSPELYYMRAKAWMELKKHDLANTDLQNIQNEQDEVIKGLAQTILIENNKAIVAKFQSDLKQMTYGEKLFAARIMDVSDLTATRKVLDALATNEQELDIHYTLVTRVAINDRRWEDKENIAKYFAIKLRWPKPELYSEAIAAAPEEQKTRLYWEAYQNCEKNVTDKPFLKAAAERGHQEARQVYAKDLYDQAFAKYKNWGKFQNSILPLEALSLLQTSARFDYAPAKEAIQRYNWEQGAENGSAECMYALGRCYENGTHGVQAYRNTALKLYEAAGEKGEMNAQYRAGKINETIGKEQYSSYYKREYMEKACAWFIKAAAQEHLEALIEYFIILVNGAGYYYDNSTEIRSELQNAIRYAKVIAKKYTELRDTKNAKAYEDIGQLFEDAQQGKPRAMYLLGLLYKTEKVAEPTYILSIPKVNNTLAWEWLNKAANAGDPDAAVVCAEYWEANSKDTNAMKWYIMAADKGHVLASYRLGMLYKKQNDMTNAKKYLLVASMKEHKLASNALGDILAQEKEPTAPFEYYTLACKGTDAVPEAMFKLAECYAKGTGTSVDADKALQWYEAAAKAGHVKAMLATAKRYEDLKNKSKANLWYTEARDKGDPDAYAGLARLAVAS